MKRLLGIAIVLVVCGFGCGERIMPEGYTGLVLGAEKGEILPVLSLQGTEPSEPVNEDGWEAYETRLVDPLFSDVKINLKFQRLAGAYFKVGKRCSKDVYYGLVRAMDEKLMCKGKEEKVHETLITRWAFCGSQREGIEVNLLYGSSNGCLISLMYETETGSWENPGEEVDI